jgi:hypothetical protein
MENLDPILIKSLRGQNSEIKSISLSPNMQQAISGSIDS